MRRFVTVLWLFALSGLFTTFLVAADPVSSESKPTWWKGNLHTHSLWSDGDDFPEMIAEWYRTHDYNFLALSDHNVLGQGPRWMKSGQIEARGGKQIFEKYEKRFGKKWVETRPVEGGAFEVRLKPFDEYRYLVEERGRFIMIPGEEISDQAEGKPVHMNATNLLEVISPVGGKTVREAMENNLRLVLEQEKKLGRQILPHLNHPNFGYAITADDLAAVVSERFFEIYNGHPGVNHQGDATHVSIERMWDLANAIRLEKLASPPLLGVATDDSHEYHGEPGSRPGRGWVMVRSDFLTPEHLIQAMKRGDFYSSSGVRLKDVQYDATVRKLSIEIDPVENAKYLTQFVVIRKPFGPDHIGLVAATSDSLSASYTLNQDDVCVRAVVTSDQPPVDPSFDGQRQQAWSQPWGWQEALENKAE